MRFTSFGIILVLMASLFAGRGMAQIPERVLFQPGSYAFGAYQNPVDDSVLVTQSEPINEWQAVFGQPAATNDDVVGLAATGLEGKKSEPYLTYYNCWWTGRSYLIHNPAGYVDTPEAFPRRSSHVSLWLSLLPSHWQNQPQIPYLDYYAPMPEIAPASPSRWETMLDNLGTRRFDPDRRFGRGMQRPGLRNTLQNRPAVNCPCEYQWMMRQSVVPQELCPVLEETSATSIALPFKNTPRQVVAPPTMPQPLVKATVADIELEKHATNWEVNAVHF